MEVKCSQCGAQVEISEESGFIVCPYCDSKLYVETESTVAHYYIKPRLKSEQVRGFISKELERLELKGDVKMVSTELVFIPFWLIRLKDGIQQFPASSLEIPCLKLLSVPVGELLPYESQIEENAKVDVPELSLDDLLNHPEIIKLKNNILKYELVHIPFFNVNYIYLDQRYSGMIDASAGRFYADRMPPSAMKEKDRYFLIMFALLSLVFLLEAFLIPKWWILFFAYIGTSVISWYLLSADIKRKGY